MVVIITLHKLIFIFLVLKNTIKLRQSKQFKNK